MLMSNKSSSAKIGEKISMLAEMIIRIESKVNILLKQEKKRRPKKEVKNVE